MSITLTPELQLLIDQKVRSGRFDSPAEVVGEALRLMDEKDQIKERRLEELRGEIIKAEEEYRNGQFIEFNSEGDLHKLGERIIRRGRDRLAAE